jgi:hypothetical protein
MGSCVPHMRCPHPGLWVHRWPAWNPRWPPSWSSMDKWGRCRPRTLDDEANGEDGETSGAQRRIELEAVSMAGWRARLGRGLLRSLPVAVRRNAHRLGRPTGRPGAS